MLYSDTPTVDVTLDRTDGRYALSLSHISPTYPTSSGRDEPCDLSRRPSVSTPASSAPLPATSTEGRSYLNYPLPDMREVQPGVLATGQWTMNHPLVDAYLSALARLAPRQRPQQGPAGPSVPSTAATSPVLGPQTLVALDAQSSPSAATLLSSSQSEDEKTRWRIANGGIASVHTVSQVIAVQYELFPEPGSAWYAMQVPRLSEEQKQVILALAALKVYNHPTHRAHWALWAKNVLRRTAETVESVFQLNPCPIVSHVGWIGLPESVWALHGYHSLYMPPPPPQPEKPKAGGMTLRKRKATAASSSKSPKEEAAPRSSPRKRQRTTRAQVALAQAQDVAEAAISAAPSMLLDVTPTGEAASADIIVEAAKETTALVSPSLQPLELPLALPDPTTPAQDESVSASTSRARSAASMSPSATRRSSRARRKPAQVPVTVATPSVSTPLSVLSTPATSPAPLEASEPTSVSSEQEKRPRAGSCGSSTAVSEAGEASEGTVVDADVSTIANTDDAKGKRKAVDLDDAEPEPVVADVAPPTTKGGRKSRAKANSRPRKRVKIDAASQDLPAPACITEEANGEDNQPPATDAGSPAVHTAKKRTASGGGGARKKAATRKA